MKNFPPLAKILHCCRQWRHGQIPPLPKVAWSFKSRRKSAQTRLTFSNKTISSFAEFFYVLHGFYFLLDDILWQGWSEQCIISGDQSISAGPFKRVKYERSSRSREIFWCQIKSRKFLQQICSSYIRVKNYKKNSHDLHVKKIPSEMEVAPRYKLLLHLYCLHYIHCLTVYTVYSVYSVYTVSTVYTTQTALQCLNSGT